MWSGRTASRCISGNARHQEKRGRGVTVVGRVKSCTDAKMRRMRAGRNSRKRRGERPTPGEFEDSLCEGGAVCSHVKDGRQISQRRQSPRCRSWLIHRPAGRIQCAFVILNGGHEIGMCKVPAIGTKGVGHRTGQRKGKRK